MTYEEKYPVLVGAAEELEQQIRDMLAGIPHVDRVSARAKEPARFARKASKADAEGVPRYSAPLQQIQDQIGARVIVFYPSDVSIVASEIESWFQPVEIQDLVPEADDSFGYFGKHWIFALPSDVIPGDHNPRDFPRFFELQVKTLFQHAWSEAQHDLGYKSTVPLHSDHRRRFAYAAAQAWGADRILDELAEELLDPTS